MTKPNLTIKFHENSVINSIIEKTINYASLSTDIVILKQYLDPSFNDDSCNTKLFAMLEKLGNKDEVYSFRVWQYTLMQWLRLDLGYVLRS